MTPVTYNFSYSSSYEAIYQPSYDYGFIFYDEDDFYDEDSYTDCVPLPAATSFANRQVGQKVFQIIIAEA